VIATASGKGKTKHPGESGSAQAVTSHSATAGAANRKRRAVMKGGVFFTGSGPVVVVTSYDSFTDPNFLEKLTAKGLKKFIVYEVPVSELKEKYGKHFDVIMNDLHQTDDLRVLDYDGHRVFNNFTLSKLKEPVYFEP
jgi:hypothetical protein